MARHFCVQKRMGKDLHLDLGELVGVASESLWVGEILGLYRSTAFVQM